MKSKIHKGLPVDILATILSEHLAGAGIDAVLSGGSAVSIYADNEYESSDLDFVTFAALEQIEPVMLELGFHRDGRHFTHPDCDYLVEFPPAPVMIGRLHVDRWTELQTPAGRLRILTPTQCVMDRLAAFYHWSDRQCLDQALMVACHHKVDLAAIERWSAAEGQPRKFQEFKEALHASNPLNQPRQ